MKRQSDQKRPLHTRRRAGLRPDERDPDDRPGAPVGAGGDKNMAGTPMGGLASGGLGGTNLPTGGIDDAVEELSDAYGEGTRDISGEEEIGGEGPYAGHGGSAVGGTPAGKRSRGGGFSAGQHVVSTRNDGRDSTVGSNPDEPKSKPR